MGAPGIYLPLRFPPRLIADGSLILARLLLLVQSPNLQLAADAPNTPPVPHSCASLPSFTTGEWLGEGVISKGGGSNKEDHVRVAPHPRHMDSPDDGTIAMRLLHTMPRQRQPHSNDGARQERPLCTPNTPK